MDTVTDIKVQEQPARVEIKQPGITIGLPRNPKNGDRRFPLTPEAVKVLVDDYRFKVYIEDGAGHEIHYSDNAYAASGAVISDRSTALRTDIVISAAPLSVNDIGCMRRNASLWSVIEPARLPVAMVQTMLKQGVTCVSLTALSRPDGHRPVADILAEIDGCAAITVAAGLLADAVHGKGILLGGVTGIVPCEVVVTGCATAGIAAARAARGLGATVRVFDNDVCRLRMAENLLDHSVIGSSLHRKVYLSALHSADIIVNTLTGDEAKAAIIDSGETQLLKKGAILFDFNDPAATVFPALKTVDLSPATETLPSLVERICFLNPGTAVPRTSAMALSNAIVPLLTDIAMADDRTFMDAVRTNSFLGTGLITFGGKLINRATSQATGIKWVDPSIFLRMS